MAPKTKGRILTSPNLVIATGSGRCGTTAISHIMARAGFCSFHEGICVSHKGFQRLNLFSAHRNKLAEQWNASALLMRFDCSNSLQKQEPSLLFHEAAPQYWLVSTYLHHSRIKIIHLYRDPVETVLSFATKFPGLYQHKRITHSTSSPFQTWDDTLPTLEAKNNIEYWAKYYELSNSCISSIKSANRKLLRMEDLRNPEKIEIVLKWINAPVKKLSIDKLIPQRNTRTRRQKKDAISLRKQAEIAVEKFVHWRPENEIHF